MGVDVHVNILIGNKWRRILFNSPYDPDSWYKHAKQLTFLNKMWLQIFQVYHPLIYERVYLPLYTVADTPFHTQAYDMVLKR